MTPNCNPAALEYFAQCCGTRENGGIGQGVFLKYAYVPTLVAALEAATTDVQRRAAWDAAETAGAIVAKLPNLRGSYDGGQPVEQPGYGRRLVDVTGINHSITVMDPSVQVNRAFYNNVLDRQDLCFWFCTESLIWNVNAPVTVSPSMPVEEGFESQVRFSAKISWTKRELPTSYPVPSHLFECVEEPQYLELESPGAATSIAAGASGTRTVNITRQGFTGDVGFTILSAPAGVTLGTVTGAGTATATIQLLVAAGTAPVVGASVVLRGTYGSLTDVKTIPITITAA